MQELFCGVVSLLVGGAIYFEFLRLLASGINKNISTLLEEEHFASMQVCLWCDGSVDVERCFCIWQATMLAENINEKIV